MNFVEIAMFSGLKKNSYKNIIIVNRKKLYLINQKKTFNF